MILMAARILISLNGATSGLVRHPSPLDALTAETASMPENILSDVPTSGKTACNRRIIKRNACHMRRLACVWCESPFDSLYQQARFCSDRCRLACNSKVRRHRIASAEREVVTVDILARKHGDSCHLCGHAVDLSLAGTHPDGPTIDHVIPVAVGGAHTLSNCRLAHRRCNAAKLDVVDGQVQRKRQPATAVRARIGRRGLSDRAARSISSLTFE